MLQKKKIDRIIYGFMTLLIMLNSLMPLTALAETTEEPLLKLEKITQGQNENLLDLVIETGQTKEPAEVNISQPVIQQATMEKNGQTTDLSVEKNQVITVPIMEAGTATIHLSLKSEALRDLRELDVTYENQKLTYQLPEIESSSEESTESTASEFASTSSNTSDEEISTSSSSEDLKTSTEASEPKKDLQPAEKAERAESPTNIRDYFPNGEGTIITGSTLTYLDDDGHVVEPPITIDTNVRISYTWSIPEDVRQQIEPGDYFDFKLPDELKPKQSLSGELKNEAGEVYAKYTVDTDGNIRFEFTEEVKNQSDIEGYFNFTTEFKKEHIDGPGDITIHYPVEDDLPPVEVEIRPNTDTSIDKKGHFDRTPNPSSVEWTVDINQSMNHLEDPTVTEKWPKGIDFQSVKVMELEMNLDGTVKEVGRELSPNEYTVDANGNVTIKGETNKAYRLVYQTAINDSIVPEDGGKVSFTNTAQLTDKNNSDGIDAKATVTNNYGKTIEKKMASYDPTNQEFKWTIKYNYNEKKISKDDAILTDTISENMDLVDGSVKLYPITFDENGKEVKGEQLKAGTDYVLEKNPNGNGFVIKFLRDVDEAVRVEYKTKVNDIVTDPTQVTNSVSTGTGQTDGDKGTAKQQNVIKDLTDVDYSKNEASWKISINKNHYYMENLVLTDTYSPIPGLSMLLKEDGTPDFKIYDVTKKKDLVAGKDYDLELVKGDEPGSESGFKVIFKGDYNPTESELELTYKTHFDVSLLDPDNPALDRFKNNMAADWQDEHGGKHHSDDDKDFKPNYPYQLNAQKSGQYNAQTKKITWSVAVNLSRNTLKGAELVDPIKDNQAYVTDSLKIYEADVKKDGTVVKKEPVVAVNDQMKKINYPSEENNQTLTVDFPEGSTQTYLIEFETSLDGKLVDEQHQYENIAHYENAGDERDVIGEVGIKNGGKYAQKSGAQDSKNPDYVNWQAVINPSQSVLNHVVITDEPSENQVIDENSIKLYQTTVAADGTITPDYDKPLVLGKDYTVEVTTDNVTGKQLLTIKLLHQIDSAYQLEYRSYITSSASGNYDKVSNKITVTGENDQVISGGDGEDVTVEISHSEGSATGKKGKIVIQKTEADGKTALAGAHFQLWNTTKTQLLREGEVDANGQITFGSLPYGEYLLVETQAPKGFTIADDLVSGRRITINAKTSAENAAALTIPNERNKVILQKTDENGNPIKFGGDIQQGARFKLEHFSNLSPAHSLWEPVALNPDRLNSDGILEIDSLPVGIYRITEVEAPAGYILNTKPTIFFVYRNSNQQLPTVNLTYKNYQGSAELIKKDSEGNPLAGAAFDVIDSKGKKVNQQPLISQADGKVHVEGLAPGKYKFVETKAPAGYVLNTKEIPFEIVEKAQGKPQLVTTQPDGSALELTNYQGSAEFIKKNKAGQTLAGAEFDLFDANDQKVNQQPIVADSKGKVHVDHLAPGKYTMKEIKAPDGYLINSKEITFTIKASNNGEVPVTELADFINYQGSFELRKVNTDGEGLKGAEFTLFKEDKVTPVKTETSDQNGKILFEHLAPGTYYYQETKAPTVAEGSDYVINPAKIMIKIEESAEGEPQVIERGDFQNFRGKAQITKVGEGGSIAGAVFKLYRIVDGVEQEVKDITTPENGILDISGLGAGSYKLVEIQPAPGYVINDQPIYFVVQENDDHNPDIDNLSFENYQAEITGYKKNEDKEALAGAKYQIFKASDLKTPVEVTNKDGEKTTEITTDETGEIYFKGLDEGSYVLIEKEAPTGYILDTEPHPFEVGSYTGKPTPIELGDFINYQGSITLTKKNEADQVLKGAEFEIRDQAGKVQTVLDEKGDETKVLTSDAEGKIFAKGLVPGKYTLVETKAPSGYLLNTTPIEFEVAKESAGKPETLTLEDFINYQGSITLTKKNEADQVLKGAEFEIRDQAGKVQTVLNEKGDETKVLTSDTEGKIFAKGLVPGKYTLVETKAPTGYLLNTTPIAFEIAKESAGKPETLTLEDFINYQGSVQMHKVSQNGKKLAGAVFELYKADKTSVGTYTADKNGLVSIENLAPGSYYLVETKAPDGYLINTQQVSFEIVEEHKGKPEVVKLKDFINYQGTVKLTKVSEEGKKLENAVFELHQKNGSLIGTYTSNKEGIISVANLAPGEYYFSEKQAPNGYDLSKEKREFKITAASENKPETIDVGTFINKKTPPTKTSNKNSPTGSSHFGTTTGSYPKTNDTRNPWLLLTGLVVIIIAGTLYYRRKKD